MGREDSRDRLGDGRRSRARRGDHSAPVVAGAPGASTPAGRGPLRRPGPGGRTGRPLAPTVGPLPLPCERQEGHRERWCRSWRSALEGILHPPAVRAPEGPVPLGGLPEPHDPAPWAEVVDSHLGRVRGACEGSRSFGVQSIGCCLHTGCGHGGERAAESRDRGGGRRRGPRSDGPV